MRRASLKTLCGQDLGISLQLGSNQDACCYAFAYYIKMQPKKGVDVSNITTVLTMKSFVANSKETVVRLQLGFFLLLFFH